MTESLAPIDIMSPDLNLLIAWLNTGRTASLTSRTAILMERYLKGWQELLVKGGGLSPDGVAELIFKYFPEETKRLLGL